MTEQRAKLRTVNDVLNRLRWSDDDDYNETKTWIGYDCRINGPMEKSTDSYTSIDKGGDIPQHRIQYIRTKMEGEDSAAPQPLKTRDIQKSLLWDRRSKLDRLFGSGDGKHAAIDPTTVQDVRRARETHFRLAEERRQRAEEKAKRRARMQQRKMMATNIGQSEAADGGSSVSRKVPYAKRHTWSALTEWYQHDGTEWTCKAISKKHIGISRKEQTDELTIVTWNILFDLVRGDGGDFVQGDNLIFEGNELDTTLSRQQAILGTLENEHETGRLDVVCLQECTTSFMAILREQEWIQKGFAIPTSAILAPYGNMTLWNKHQWTVSGLHVCWDSERTRAILCSLHDGNDRAVNVANVHLPADKHDQNGNVVDRTQARQRELSAIIGKLQILEMAAQTPSTEVIAGDFNNVPSGSLMAKTLPKNIWFDTWDAASSDDGLTFDWSTNERARKSKEAGNSLKPSRRIDYIWCGKQQSLKATAAKLLDDVSSSSGIHPSDHFGIAVTLAMPSCVPPLYQILNCNNAWGTAALPSTNSILALIVDNDNFPIKMYDANSTLPLPHLTLLNGFVDLASPDTVQLAMKTAKKAISESLSSDNTPSLSIESTSFDVFEHSLSATAVCKPCDAWLFHLYKTLRHYFPACHEQESRFATGWTPHLSLGTFEDKLKACEFLDKIQFRSRKQLQVCGIGMFQRSQDDDSFHVVDFAPLQQAPDPTKGNLEKIWQDAGKSQSVGFKAHSIPLINEIEKALRFVVSSISNQRGMELQCKINRYGSAAIEAALPGISDLDLVAVVQSRSQADDARFLNASSTAFLKTLIDRIAFLYEGAKIRLHISSSNGTALQVLTVHIPGFLSADILLCRVDSRGQCLDAASQCAMDSIEESKKLLQMVSSFCGAPHASKELAEAEIFFGALRIVKLWAFRRQIYGSSAGYLGGGGWAVLLGWVWQKENMPIHCILTNCGSSAEAASELAKYFFVRAASLMEQYQVISLQGISTQIDRARSNLSIVGPMGGEYGGSSTAATTVATNLSFLEQPICFGESLGAHGHRW